MCSDSAIPRLQTKIAMPYHVGGGPLVDCNPTTSCPPRITSRVPMPIKFEDKEQKPCRPSSHVDGVEEQSFVLPASMIVYYWGAQPATPKQPDTTTDGAQQIRQGRPLKGQEHQTLAATKPWEQCNPPLSRRTWYRRRAKGLL